MVWTGLLLVVPAGLHRGSSSTAPDNATLVYKRGEWASPFVVLKGIPKVWYQAIRAMPLLPGLGVLGQDVRPVPSFCTLQPS